MGSSEGAGSGRSIPDDMHLRLLHGPSSGRSHFVAPLATILQFPARQLLELSGCAQVIVQGLSALTSIHPDWLCNGPAPKPVLIHCSYALALGSSIEIVSTLVWDASSDDAKGVWHCYPDQRTWLCTGTNSHRHAWLS